jgi:prepilin-type N-terminal cleavage/methylation domain-containing protein
MHSHGFTLIELLTVIAVIGLLASVLLVATNGVRDDAKDAAVLAQMKSAQVAMTRCLNKGKVMYCRGKDYVQGGSTGTETDCTGNHTHAALPGYTASTIARVKNNFDPESSFCGIINGTTPDPSFGVWPNVTEYGFRYGSFAGSDVNAGRFAFYVHERKGGSGDRVVICCTQQGCELSEMSQDDLGFYHTTGNPLGWSYTNFCRMKAGLTSTGYIRSGVAGPTAAQIGTED